MLDIIEEHFEELDFLWEQREGVIFAPDWNLKELAELEERAEAHLDGLRIGAEHSAEIVRPALAGEERGAATAAAFTLMSTGNPQLEAEVVKALASPIPEVRDGVRIGLRHSDISRVAGRLQDLAAQGDLEIRAAAVDVLAFHRLAVPRGLPELTFQAGPELRTLVNGSIGRLGGPWSIDEAQKAVNGGPSPWALSALQTSARLGLPNLAQVCRQAASRPQDPSPAALAFLGVLGDPQDMHLLLKSLGRSILARGAVEGIGALGRVTAIPQLIDAMTLPDLAPAAGEAFMRVTGASGIEADTPLPPPKDLPEDELDFFDPITPPDPGKARAWWEREKGRFTEEGRWQAGFEVSTSPLGEVFHRLPLACRRDVYLAARARDAAQTPDLELENRARLQLVSR